LSGGLLRPSDIGAADAERILRFLNAVPDIDALAETVGFSDGLAAGRRVAAELIAARPFGSLERILAVTGVGPLRFTEIAVALSAARPPLATDVLRFLPVDPVLWLGQTAGLTVQLTNPDGLGVVSRHVTCIASDGVITARSGLQVQTGSAVRIAPEPGGVVRFGYGPLLTPRLDETERAALGAALAQLDTRARTPAEAARDLRALAARYRAEGAGALQAAVDRLFAAYETEGAAARAPWPVRPVTLLALTHDADGQVLQAASLTLELRNWLGAFELALQGEIEADKLLPGALANLAADAEAGRDLSRQIVLATQGFSALERGVLGRRLRDASTARAVNAFLETAAPKLEGDAIVNTVRAAGASEAAIAAGGFGVFEAIRTVQESGDTIKPPAKVVGLSPEALLPLDARIATLEDTTVSRDALSQAEARLTSDLESRLADLDGRLVGPDDLDRLRRDIGAEVDAKLEAGAVTPSDLAQFERRLTADLEDRLARLDDDIVTRADLDRVQAALANEFDAKIAGLVSGREVDSRFEALDARFTKLEEGAVRPADLTALRTGMTAEFDGKLAQATTGPGEEKLAEVERRLDSIEDGLVRASDLDALRSALSRDFDTRLKKIEESAVTTERLRSERAEIDRQIEAGMQGAVSAAALDAGLAAVRAEMAAKLRGKANARTITDLKTTLEEMSETQARLTTDLDKLEARIEPRTPTRPPQR
jgi:hypothetical protein